MLKDFMGLCVHTIQFKPDLYKPICRLVRDYHGFNWDVGKDTDFKTIFPFARNKVNWEQLYGGWVKKGYEVDTSIMFNGTKPESWKDLEKDAYKYGKEYASFFGPSGKLKVVTTAEVGNEPGDYDDATYRKLFESMAKGFRDGDPKLKIATCAAEAGKSHKYAKSLSCVKGLEDMYDIINIHIYAQLEGWPTWKRSFPEDPKLPNYLKKLKDIIEWRDKNAIGKELWVTEFGWDCTTKPNHKDGTFKKWVGVTDLQQAQYLVRSFLVFSAMDIDRAYIYFFNDNDAPSLHAAAGLTRDFQPKPSFYAVSQLYATLGDYRFGRVVEKKSGQYLVYEYHHEKDQKKLIWVAWSPTGDNKETEAKLDIKGMKLLKAAKMTTQKADKPEAADVKIKGSSATLTITESPVYIYLEKK
ncbi:MAG: hypothetical protein JXR97_09430 [Planctomycetes bacterium]|nr:hypothetical protein [Planctomycetota bacterium]